VTKGIAEDRMTTAGYAWDRPVAPNTTRAGRALNRRTELIRQQ
jgi:outer membrane protein OmpA-like peptidoglycan-associated protein